MGDLAVRAGGGPGLPYISNLTQLALIYPTKLQAEVSSTACPPARDGAPLRYSGCHRNEAILSTYGRVLTPSLGFP
jgi:hypothetical protein